MDILEAPGSNLMGSDSLRRVSVSFLSPYRVVTSIVPPFVGIVTTLRIGQSRVLHQGVKWPGSEVDHSPPTSADVRNEWHYIATHGMEKDDFTFYMIFFP
jgi:hypothetical protein